MSRSGSVEYCAIEAEYVAAVSAAAVLIGFGGREIWVPKSLIHESDLPQVRTGDPTEINVASWFAKREGLI